MAGKLYMIGSPIGNLGDISPRAVDVLSSLDRLYCEDTRVTGKLLSMLGITASLKSLSDDSPASSWQRAVEYVQEGKTVGFITDAGMPGLSDPGRNLLKLAWDEDITLTVLPGPSAVGSLIALCPFSCHQFSFKGFAPRKDGEVAKFIETISKSSQPVFFFDSPKRVHKLMAKLCNELSPDREIIVGRELTKIHEQVVLFSASQWPEISTQILAKGEFTVAVSANQEPTMDVESKAICEALERLEGAGFSKRDAAKAAAAVLNLNSNEVKRAGYSGVTER